MNMQTWETELTKKLANSTDKKRLLDLLIKNYKQARQQLQDERKEAVKTNSKTDLEIASEDMHIAESKIARLGLLLEEVI